MSRKLAGARWVPPDQLHLTLRFVGDADESLFQAIKGELGRVKGAPLQIGINGTGHFPPGNRARVLWAGVHGETACETRIYGTKGGLRLHYPTWDSNEVEFFYADPEPRKPAAAS